MAFKNKTVVIREVKDDTHPFTRLSNSLLKLDGYERAIMHELLSNSDEFIVNKKVVQKRLGFPHKKFHDAWMRLEEKYYIRKERFFGGVKWIISENPQAGPDEIITDSNRNDIVNTDADNASEHQQTYSNRNDIVNTDIVNICDGLTTNNKNNKEEVNKPELSKTKDARVKGELPERGSATKPGVFADGNDLNKEWSLNPEEMPEMPKDFLTKREEGLI